jgi:hypothetical protein
VAGLLAEAGHAQRLVVRRPDAVSVLPLAEIATASYGDSSAARRALGEVFHWTGGQT